jgi:DNA (cytosine-5)-methyltransferase 1
MKESISRVNNFRYPPFPVPHNPKFTFVDLFAGIGGTRLAFQNVGGKCVFSSEWNSFAKRTYAANFGEVPAGDLRGINARSIPDHDVLIAGFPCQPFSLAGIAKRNTLGRGHGFADKSQGRLFFEIIRILRVKKPKAFMLENVKHLRTYAKGKVFQEMNSALTRLGYSIYYRVLDGKFYVPQHRERLIIVGFRKGILPKEKHFRFPLPLAQSRPLKDILQRRVAHKYTISDRTWQTLWRHARKHAQLGNGFGYCLADKNGISRTLTARYYKDGSEILIPQKARNPRKLTPRECARLQGFPNSFMIPVSDTQAYIQFGNSVVVPLIQEIALYIRQTIFHG